MKKLDENICLRVVQTRLFIVLSSVRSFCVFDLEPGRNPRISRILGSRGGAMVARRSRARAKWDRVSARVALGLVASWRDASHARPPAPDQSYAGVRPVAFANFFVALRLVARCAARPSAPWSHSERSQCPAFRSVTPESASSFKDGSHGPLSAIRPTSPAAGATRPSAPLPSSTGPTRAHPFGSRLCRSCSSRLRRCPAPRSPTRPPPSRPCAGGPYVNGEASQCDSSQCDRGPAKSYRRTRTRVHPLTKPSA